MFHVVSLVASALVLIGCAVRPPEPPTAAQLAVPHTVLVDAPRASVQVDANLNLSQPVAIPLSPIGLIVAGAINVGGAVVNSAIASNRTTTRDELAARLGDTAAASADFSAAFDAELRRRLDAVPGLRIARFEQALRGADVVPDGTFLALYRDVVVSSDGRYLVARATALHAIGEGAARRFITRSFVAFSNSVAGASAEDTIARWSENGGGLLRERAREMATDLAGLLRSAVFSTETLDVERLPSVSVNTSGVSAIAGTSSEGREGTFQVSARARGRLVSSENGRVTVLAALGPANDRWTWISVPAGSVERDRTS